MSYYDYGNIEVGIFLLKSKTADNFLSSSCFVRF